MSVYHNIAAFRLPENLGQHHAGKCLGCHQIPQHLPRSHGRKLVHVPHKNQTCARHDCPKQRLEQINIHHGHFIDNDHVCFQRVIFVPFKSRLPVSPRKGTGKLQHPVNGPCFIPGCLRHALGCASCGRRQKNIQFFLFKIFDNGVNRGGFSRTGTAGQNEHAVFHTLEHRFFL